MDKSISAFDAQIRSGQGGAVRAELSKLSEKKQPRELLSDYAWLAWRVGAPELGAKWLNPIVRAKARSPVVASPKEKAEYACCLVRLGAVDEALTILSTISSSDVPRAPLYQVFGWVAHWRYAETVPTLRAFIRNAPSDYDRLVASVNLAAALVVLRKDAEALRLLGELEKETVKAKHLLLLGNIRELQAAAHVRARRWKDALSICETAASDLKDHGGVFALLLDKWAAISRLGTHKTPGSINELSTIKDRALKLGHWETIRDCDRFESFINHDETLFLKLFFGTPYPEFRESLKIESGFPIIIPETYDWSLQGEKSGPVVNLTGPIGSTKPGQQNHRCLTILASDFYRPFRVAQLHALLFPGEFYNPQSSPHRVTEAVHRLKTWLKKAAPPLQVTNSEAGYQLSAKSPITLRVSASVVDEDEGKIRTLLDSFGDEPFAVSEAMQSLGLARRTMTRLLQDWTESGKLIKTGAGRSTRYRCTR